MRVITRSPGRSTDGVHASAAWAAERKTGSPLSPLIHLIARQQGPSDRHTFRNASWQFCSVFFACRNLTLSGNTQKYGQAAVNFLHDGIAGLTDVRAQLFARNGYRLIHHHLRFYG